MFSQLSHASIEEKIEGVKERNKSYSEMYRRDTIKRRIYLEKHPTAIVAFKCMDGRVHIPILTKSPLGIIKPFRRLGGIFDLGWPHFMEKFKNWLNLQKDEGKQCLALISYHFSKGDPKRGCAGFNYDIQAALDFTKEFKAQIKRTLAYYDNSVYPIIVGLETDSDALIFHADNGNKIDLSERFLADDQEILDEFVSLYPDMPEQMLYDLTPLVMGNIKHIQEVKKENRPAMDIEHREWIIGLGTGFDWLHAPNTALIVGPWSPHLDKDMQKAFSIIQSNIKEGRISDDGVVLLVSSEWNEHPEDRLVTEKVNFLMHFAMDILNQEEFKDLKPKVKIIPVIVDESKKFRIIEDELAQIGYCKRY